MATNKPGDIVYQHFKWHFKPHFHLNYFQIATLGWLCNTSPWQSRHYFYAEFTNSDGVGVGVCICVQIYI